MSRLSIERDPDRWRCQQVDEASDCMQPRFGASPYCYHHEKAHNPPLVGRADSPIDRVLWAMSGHLRRRRSDSPEYPGGGRR